MEISIAKNQANDMGFVSLCSYDQDRELLLDMAAQRIRTKQIPDFIDMIGRNYAALRKSSNFFRHLSSTFSQIWRSFQRVVWDAKGTVGIDVKIQAKHVLAFLRAINIEANDKSHTYLGNVMTFLRQGAEQFVVQQRASA